MESFSGIKDRDTNKVAYIYCNDISNEEYFLGQGQYGSVFKGMHYDQDKQEAGEPVAIKKIHLQGMGDLNEEDMDETQKAIQAEIKIFKLINKKLKNNPYLVGVEGIYQTRNHVYIIMEFCGDGDLSQLMQKREKSKQSFSEDEAMVVIKSLITGLSALHKNNIWHRDVKPGNILIKDDKYKVCDYGFTKIVESNPGSKKDFTKIGTPYYCCPQILHNKKYSSKCDVFSVGVLLYQLLFFRLPWSGNNLPDLAKNVVKVPLQFPKGRKLSQNMTILLKKLLAIKESNRPLAEEVIQLPEYQQLCEKLI